MAAQGKSLIEIETFCQAFMTELSKHIGGSPYAHTGCKSNSPIDVANHTQHPIS